MRKLSTNPNIDNSDPANFPDGRIKNNTGAGDGTPVDERVYGDIHQLIAYLMRRYNIVPNELPDNVTNGYQIAEAFKALPAKNDFIIPLSSASGVLQTNVKLGSVEENEYFICLASNDYSSETQIKGTDSGVFSVTTNQPFKSGEFVRMVKKASVVEISRLVDFNNIDAVVAAYNFLKAATYSQEIAGTSNQVATNPLSNALSFVERVNGSSSSMSLATALRNGLYSKEHFEIVSNLGTPDLRNKGFFSGLDLGGTPVGQNLTVGGDVLTAVVTNSVDNFSIVRCTLRNSMPNNNYKINISLESQGSFNNDTRTLSPMFKIINNNTFDIACREYNQNTQNLKFHLEAIKY